MFLSVKQKHKQHVSPRVTQTSVLTQVHTVTEKQKQLVSQVSLSMGHAQASKLLAKTKGKRFTGSVGSGVSKLLLSEHMYLE